MLAGHSYFVRTGGVAVHQVHAAYPFDPGQTGRGKRRTVADSGSSSKGTPENGATDNKGAKTEPVGEHETGSKQWNVGVLNSAEADLHIHISDLPTREVERFLPGNRSRKALEMLADIFLGAWQEFDVTVSVSPDERKTYLKPTGDASPCYLGINTYL